MSLYVFDRDENLVAILEQGNKNSCQYWNGKIKRVLNGETTLTLTVDYSHDDAKKIVEWGYIAVQNKYKQWELFLITQLDQKHDANMEMDITAEGSQVELDGVNISYLMFDRKNTDVVLPSILTGTRWQLGTTIQTTADVHDLTIKNESVLSALQDFRDRWGVELNFYVTIAGNKISGRFVECYVQRGAWKGKRFEWNKDLTSVTRLVNASSIKTALTGIGPQLTIDNPDGTQTQTDMDFSSVTWSVANGDPVNKPAGQTWVGSDTAKSIYGKPLTGGTEKEHIFGFHTESGATSPADLLSLTWSALESMLTPAVTYTMKTVDLYQILGIEYESTSLGDTVAVIDHDLEVEIQARIIEQDENLDYPEQDESVLGNFLPQFTGIAKQSGTMTQLAEQVNKTGAIDPLWVSTEFGFARDAIRTGKGTVIMNDDEGILIVDDPVNPQKAIRLLGGQLALASTRDLTTGEFNWRTFGTGEGFLSDLVETGYLRFDRSQGGTLTLGGAITGYQDMTSEQIVTFDGKVNGDGDNTRKFMYDMQSTRALLPTEYGAEVSAGYANTANPDDGLSTSLSITNTQHYKFRYIRDWLKGNTVNAYNYWNEIEAWTGLTNRCSGKTATISSGTLTNGINITNGNHADYGYESSGDGVAKNVLIDLGAVYTDIDTIKVFHFYTDGRTFHGAKTEISQDGVTWTTIYDSAVSGEYVETSSGKTYTPATGTAVNSLIQYMTQYVVDKANLRENLTFTVKGATGSPFTVKPFNVVTGTWDNAMAVTYAGTTPDPVELTLTDFDTYVATDGTVRFNVVSPPLTADTTVTLTVDYFEMDYSLYTATVPVYQSGTLNIVNSEGHQIASLSGDTRGFDNLWVGDISGNNVVTWNNKGDLTYYVDPINGNDANTGLATTSPFKTVQRAISLIPMINPNTVIINVVGTGITWYENISFRGFLGSGEILLLLGNSNTLKGWIAIAQCQQAIHIRTVARGSFVSTANTSPARAEIQLQENTNGSSVINAYCNQHVEVVDVVCNGNNLAPYGVNNNGGFMLLNYAEAYNCSDSAVLNQFGGRVEIENCAGSNLNGVTTAHSSITGGTGRGFYGTSGNHVKNLYGAVCSVVWTYDQGAVKPIYTPTKTTQWTNNDHKSLFGTNWGLTDYLMMGQRPTETGIWTGVAFFNTRDFSALKNADGTLRTIRKVRLLVQRYKGYGDNNARKPKIWWNAQTSASGSMSSLQNGTWSNQTFLWGEQKWIDLPVAFGTAFQNGKAKSICFYNGADQANYARYEQAVTLEITHG